MEREQRIEKCHDFWLALFQRGFDRSPFQGLCTLLRPRGMHDAGWDVLDESQATFDDFNWMLQEAHKERGTACARRLALHYYCFIIEMSPLHEMILNLLRCISGESYLPYPFIHLHRKRKKTDETIPPSMPTKVREITKLAQSLGESDLIKHLKYVFDENIRNAIAHSDYTLTVNEFRIRENGRASAIPLRELDRKVNFSFEFVSGLLKAHKSMKYAVGHAKRFHRWENFEVLELLKDETGVNGFRVHFSNGSSSKFTRTHEGATAINMRFRDGVGFMVGDLGKLEPVWKVNGVPVTDWDKLNEESETKE